MTKSRVKKLVKHISVKLIMLQGTRNSRDIKIMAWRFEE